MNLHFMRCKLHLAGVCQTLKFHLGLGSGWPKYLTSKSIEIGLVGLGLQVSFLCLN